ncbi:lipocalin family protein [Flavobacterium sp.]|uniref:lipocalin family protein n=1 Tax=Flavobacterium sp. TaxID=239 RepID=UPI0037C1200C
MKKSLLLTLTLILVTTLIGCSKDDDNNSSPTLVGKWRTVKFEYYTNGVLDETETIVEENSTCPDYIEFKTNGTYVVINNNANCNSTADESGSYVYNGTTIATTSAGSTDTSIVISLTNTDLKIDFTETSSDGTVFKNVGYFKKIN